MAGFGPVPNRSEDLARPRERKGGEPQPVTKGKSKPATIPEPDPGWHRVARMLWDAALESGQAEFYESSDYAYLYYVCNSVSKYESSNKPSSMFFAALNQAMTTLLLTEGDRRRVRLELADEDTTEDDAVVAQMDDYRKGLRAV